MNCSKTSDKFPQDFIDLLDDMLTESTSMGETDFVDDLLKLISTRLVALDDYYTSNLNSVQHYQNQIAERKVKSKRTQDVWIDYTEISEFLSTNNELIPYTC